VQTEDEVIVEAPSKVTLGKKEYEIKQLKIGKAMEWRTKYGPQLSKVMAAYGAEANSPEVFMEAFVNCPQLMLDAVFDYAPNFPREKVMEEATEQQMMTAFVAVMGFAFGPFLGGVMFLTGLKKQMDKTASAALEQSSRLQ